jgi:hypothetical protein
METKKLLRELQGTQTIESVKSTLAVSRQKAIYYIYRLRKQGYVKTRRQGNKRIYSISFENKLGGTSYYDIINENSPVKINTSEIYKIYGKKPSLEETLVYAIKTKSLRLILASLALFKKIHNWNELYSLSKRNHVERQAAALYDLARTIMRTRKMGKMFINKSLPKKYEKYVYIIEHLSSKDFKEIENKWKVYLPFNRDDLEGYK